MISQPQTTHFIQSKTTEESAETSVHTEILKDQNIPQTSNVQNVEILNPKEQLNTLSITPPVEEPVKILSSLQNISLAKEIPVETPKETRFSHIQTFRDDNYSDSGNEEPEWAIKQQAQIRSLEEVSTHLNNQLKIMKKLITVQLKEMKKNMDDESMIIHNINPYINSL